MADTKKRDVRDIELAFFGSVCASLSHELNNVMAIIGELNGLMEDIAEAGDTESDPRLARMNKAIGRVSAQVQRGADYVKQLNGFAHSVDNKDAALDSLSVLKESVVLCNRFAKLKRAQLILVNSDESPRLSGSIFNLHHIFIRAIKAALFCANEGDSIDIELSAKNGACLLRLASPKMDLGKLEGSDELKSLEELLAGVGGGVETIESNSGASLLEIEIPQSVNPSR